MQLALFSGLEGLAEKLHYAFTAVSPPLGLSILKLSSPEVVALSRFPPPPALVCWMGSLGSSAGG